MGKCWRCGRKGLFLHTSRDGLCKKCREQMKRYETVMGKTVFVFGNGRVYHKSPFCSDSKSIPNPISEKVAIIQGLTRCRKCW